ncbi:MAG TPA: hypothetical protein VNW04_04480 [Puia sp.]|jgi:hypothetical protein|nr:hypothetical protein [Puia sp.]
MKTFIIFDNGCNTLDRYTIINQETGDVFGCSENPDSPKNPGRFIGNCAARHIVLPGAGWRQKLPPKRIIRQEAESYINNARLDPDWIGREVPLGILPDGVRRWVAQLASRGRAALDSAHLSQDLANATNGSISPASAALTAAK